MRYDRLLALSSAFSVTLLSFAVACTEESRSPTANIAPSQPLFANGGGGGGGNPTFKTSTYSVPSNSPFSLSHAFSQGGMGNFTNVPYSLTANFTATLYCRNGGGNKVNGNPFQIEGVATTGDVTLPQRNGSISGTLTVSVANAVEGADCGNHTPVITSVTWYDIKFCWGTSAVDANATVATLQGPLPGGVDSGIQLTTGQSATGTPLTGNKSGTTQSDLGIFATCTST